MPDKDVTKVPSAFAHPESRAKAMALPGVADRLSLRDHIVSVEIGAFQGERDITQRLRFNVVVEVRGYDDPLDDDVDKILSYDRIAEAIAAELAAERLNLLETLAERVCARILHEDQALRVFLRVEKLDRGPGDLGVEIVRAKADASSGATPKPLTSAQILLVQNQPLTDLDLSDWLHKAEANATPTILVVGPAEGARPRTEDQAAQLRIDLLAIEQNAWALAASVPDLSVVSTRTELDWALKNNHISIWAPSKLILDTPDAPQTASPEPLAHWLAVQIGATVRDTGARD